MKQKKQFLQWSIVLLFCMSQWAWGQAVPTVTGNETYTIGRSTSLTTPANIKSAAHYQVTNSGTDYLNHAIQTALNAGYTKIYIEEGEYLVTAPINFYKSNLGTNSKPLLSGIIIEGAGKGTIIKPFSTTIGHIFNLGVFQLSASERLTNTYCENNIIQNLFLDLDNKIKTGIRIGGRGQYNSIENIWIQNAAVASTESYRTSFVIEEKYEDGKLVQKFQDVNATVATGAGAIYVDLPIDIAYVPNASPSNPSGLAYEAGAFDKHNLTFQELSIELGKFAKVAIKENPGEYLKQVVFRSWFNFWKPTFKYNDEKFNFEYANKVCVGIWYFQRVFLILFRISFLLLVPFYIYQFFKKKILTNEVIIVVIVFGNSVLQAIVTFGTNDRYSFPYEFIMIILVLMFFKSNVISNTLNTSSQ